ncbi:hypothetical protein [Vibrio coralliilyticus]|uniref:hypothetical protein n=1 Tax=Vibrio coralliilyticus TaxID=190893 RepID=UPI000C16ED38|nr:hypothetical protein [Vibrio coralliilyticus]
MRFKSCCNCGKPFDANEVGGGDCCSAKCRDQFGDYMQSIMESYEQSQAPDSQSYERHKE